MNPKRTAKIALALYSILLCSFSGLIGWSLRGEGKKTVIESASSSISKEDVYFIVQSASYPRIEGGVSLVVDYAKNGEVQLQTVFDDKEDRDNFIHHLDSLGKVLNKGALK